MSEANLPCPATVRIIKQACATEVPISFQKVKTPLISVVGLIFGRDMRLKFHYRGDVQGRGVRRIELPKERLKWPLGNDLGQLRSQKPPETKKTKGRSDQTGCFSLITNGEGWKMWLIILMALFYRARGIPRPVLKLRGRTALQKRVCFEWVKCLFFSALALWCVP